MTANFVQTDAKGRSAAGTLQLKRPGRIRFQYGGGDMLLVGNGNKLTFVDYQVGQKSSWDLYKTPLGLLLSANPDLGRIARILPNTTAACSWFAPATPPPRVRNPGPGVRSLRRPLRAACGSKAGPRSTPRTSGPRSSSTDQRYNVAVPESAFTYAEPQKTRR